VQAFVLHAFCDFCLLSAGLTLSISIIAAIDFFSRSRHYPSRQHPGS
jgi:hypothetical protein